MKQESIDNQRFRAVFEYLKKRRYVRNQQDFSERVDTDKATVSQIMNDRVKIPNIMLTKIDKAFPFISTDWLLTGEGEMLKATYTQTVHGGENFTQTGNISVIPSELLGKALDEIAEMRRALTQALALNQQHTSRLMAMLERLNPPANPLNRP